ncbi:MAG: carboxypeptidase regulatory-like domain-containing protein [Deltaproteobacteria bacterium]|nr:carboxypeptidase regulatory-like domain-containing protein [Deltaproteobacteria bacterium]
MSTSWLLIFVLPFTLNACGRSESPPPGSPQASGSRGTGQAGTPTRPSAPGVTVSGTVKLGGPVPSPHRISVNKDQAVCGKETAAEELVVESGGGVRWAVVTVEGATARSPGKAVLDQKGCMFVPHVLVVAPGQEIDVLNSDGILHNIHTHSSKNAAFNMAQPKFKKVITTKFDHPEVVRVNCDVHGWMQGWIVVTDTPAAVTDADGSFTIPNVPPGEYTAKVWHEGLGERTQEVTVRPDGATVSFELAKS